MAERRFPHLLQAMHDDEHLDRCDQLTRGEATPDEVDADLTEASPDIQVLRRLSAPPDPAFQARLADVLLALPVQTPDAAAPSVAAPAALPHAGTVTPLRPVERAPQPEKTASKRSSWSWAAPLALAASVGIVALWGMNPSGPPPTGGLEAALVQRGPMGDSDPVAGKALQAPRGGCVKLRWRPEHRYRGSLKARAALVPQFPGAQPFTWDAGLEPQSSGLLEQTKDCMPLPAQAISGRWQIAVVYGWKLPDDATFLQRARSESPQPPPTSNQPWRIDFYPLVITE